MVSPPTLNLRDTGIWVLVYVSSYGALNFQTYSDLIVVTLTIAIHIWLLSNLNKAFDIKPRTVVFKFHLRDSESIVEYNVGLKTLLQQDISEPIVIAVNWDIKNQIKPSEKQQQMSQ